VANGGSTGGKWSAGKVGGAIFVAIINALALAGAVVGTGTRYDAQRILR
jgi:hypothetical protein